MASIRVTEKLGFEPLPDSAAYYCLFDEKDHRRAAAVAASALSAEAEEAVRARRFAGGARLYAQVFALRERSDLTEHHLAARCWAAL